MDPGGLLAGSCVFLRFQLDSMFAFQWALPVVLTFVLFLLAFGLSLQIGMKTLASSGRSEWYRSSLHDGYV